MRDEPVPAGWPAGWRADSAPEHEDGAFVTHPSVHAESGRRASLRRPLPALERDPFVRRLLEREAEAVAAIRHPCTVRVPASRATRRGRS